MSSKGGVNAEIEQTAVRILEDWALMLVEPIDKEEQVFAADEPYLVTQVKFKGPFDGTYSFVCQRGFARALTGNLIGDEADFSESNHEDALRELANVLSGNLLTNTFGEDLVFGLTSPEYSERTELELGPLLNGAKFVYRGDDEPIAIMFKLNV